jgi:hypothetical protein
LVIVGIIRMFVRFENGLFRVRAMWAQHTVVRSEVINGISPGPCVGGQVAVFVTLGFQQYSVSGDGQRFLINVTSEGTGLAPINVIYNWQPKGVP